MSRFEYIFEKTKALQNKKYSVKKYCSSLSVSEGGYYKWRRSRCRASAQLMLIKMIFEILEEHKDNDNYGVDRMVLALAQKGVKKSRSTVLRAMRAANLVHKSHRSPDGLTKADKKAQRPANLIKRDFTANEPNKKWLTDITQIKCSDGKLYIAPVMDCFGGEIISLAMDDNMKKELCLKTASDALKMRKPQSGLIFHSDAGSQYTSDAYKKFLGKNRVIQSMSDAGKCYDNARMESFFATLKKEKLYRLDTMRMTMEEVKTAVWRFVQYYNRIRICSFNEGGFPPSVYREKTAMKLAA